MSEDVSGWTATKKLKYNILKRAFNEYRGADAILKIQWRMAYERYKNEGFVAALSTFQQKYGDQPRAIRMLNLIAEKEGRNAFYGQKVQSFPDLLRMHNQKHIHAEFLEFVPLDKKRMTATAVAPDPLKIAALFTSSQIQLPPKGGILNASSEEPEYASVTSFDKGKRPTASAEQPEYTISGFDVTQKLGGEKLSILKIH